jgi:hypothetical protein
VEEVRGCAPVKGKGKWREAVVKGEVAQGQEAPIVAAVLGDEVLVGFIVGLELMG